MKEMVELVVLPYSLIESEWNSTDISVEKHFFTCRQLALFNIS